MLWLSSGFPVGSFAYSHGLEWAASAGDVRDRATLIEWLAALLEHGAPRNDAILLEAAFAAASEEDAAALWSINELALAVAGSRERHLETSAQGSAFMKAVCDAWPTARLRRIARDPPAEVAYPVAVATAAAAHGLELGATLEAFIAAQMASMVSAAIRLGVVGHTDGQRVVSELLPAVRCLAGWAKSAALDDLGGAAFRSDLAAIRHETQYTRLFRS